MTDRQRNPRLVSDGRARCARDAAAAIRKNVEREYAEQLAGAAWWRRLLLRVLMAREVRRQVREQAPRDALYLAAPPTRPRRAPISRRPPPA